jgi:hypothetical protein
MATRAVSQWPDYGTVEVESNVVPRVIGDGAVARWTIPVSSFVLPRGQDTAFATINDGSSTPGSPDAQNITFAPDLQTY